MVYTLIIDINNLIVDHVRILTCGMYLISVTDNLIYEQ